MVPRTESGRPSERQGGLDQSGSGREVVEGVKHYVQEESKTLPRLA